MSRGRKIIVQLRFVYGAINLSNGKVPHQLSTKFQFQLSDVAVKEFPYQPTDCPRVVTSKFIIRYSISVEAESLLGVLAGCP